MVDKLVKGLGRRLELVASGVDGVIMRVDKLGSVETIVDKVVFVIVLVEGCLAVVSAVIAVIFLDSPVVVMVVTRVVGGIVLVVRRFSQLVPLAHSGHVQI